MVEKKFVRLNGQEFEVMVKKVNAKDLTSECWPVQVWGLAYCSGFGDYERMCEYLATEECGGQRIRKLILTGKYPKDGLKEAE